MTKPRTPINTFGAISFGATSGGRVSARTRYRDDDGRLRLVQASGKNRRDAERRLKVKLAHRQSQTDAIGELTADSSFADLAKLWLDDLAVRELAESTRDLYERNMCKLVLPAFENFTLREVSVARVDRFLKAQARISHSRAKQAKNVLSQALGLAVRYEAIPRNPVGAVDRLRKPPSKTVALTPETVRAIRTAVREWRRGGGLSGPKPDGQLEAIIDVMLGTSARIGEALALRKCDVDVTKSPPTVRIAGTVVSPSGRPPYRQDHPKTSKSRRTVAAPSFTAEALRQRLARLGQASGGQLIFVTRNGTALAPNNVRRRLRAIMAEADIEGVTPHAFRRTVATVLSQASGAELAAEMLGHTSPDITRTHYIEDDGRVDPTTADILEHLGQDR